MKTRTLVAIIYCLTLTALAVWLVLERQACAQIHRANTALLGRLNEAMEKLAESQRLPEPTAPATVNLSAAGGPASSPASADPELLRLRSELDGLIQQHQQTESLRDDTRQTQAALENRKKEDRAARRAAKGSVSQLEIVKAQYWTANTNMDVTDEIQDRIRGDSLKAMANNNIKGDPEFGQVKHLTIEYRFGGVPMTNEFREGDIIVLPPQ